MHENTTQGTVKSLIEETKDLLLEQKKYNVSAIDVETTYVAKFFREHSNVNGSVYLVVSDETMGEVTYDKYNTILYQLDANLGKVIDSIFRKKEPQKLKNMSNHPCRSAFIGFNR